MRTDELVRFYFDTMSLNDQLTQWYRAVFVAFHGGIVLTMLLIIVWERTEEWRVFMCPLLWFGLLISVLWVYLTSHRAHIVHVQKKKMLAMVDKCIDPDIKNAVQIYRSKLAKCLPEFIFNLMLPVAVGLLIITICDYSTHAAVSWDWSGLIGGIFSLLSVIIWLYYLAKDFEWVTKFRRK